MAGTGGVNQAHSRSQRIPQDRFLNNSKMPETWHKASILVAYSSPFKGISFDVKKKKKKTGSLTMDQTQHDGPQVTRKAKR